HIAHGLVPAATIAPKPAAPRTPPPRSPNPSPERPRSALAAAILATTLTGRTVAIPQPQQPSLSEGDSTYLEQECFEPYATVTELRIRSDWKLDGCDRSPLQSLEISGNYGEDEDMDTFLSDADKEAESSNQSNEKREGSFSTNAIYSVPCKTKKVRFLNALVPLPCCNILMHVHILDALYSLLSLQMYSDENLIAENLIHDKPPPSPDVSVRARQVWENRSKEKFRELEQENWSLNKAYRAMVQQLEGTKRQMEEQQLKLKKLEKENRRLQEAAENSHREEEAAELHSLRQQAQELIDENDALKTMVHRLNVELSRYQTKFRPLSQEENLKVKSLPMKGPQPPWLLDMKYLSPLLLAYEDRIREKEDFILEHEANMKNFKTRVEELVKENEDLHDQLNNSITPTAWQLLQSQAKLVVGENGLLMEQLKIQQAKAKDSHRQHVQEAAKLTKQIAVLEDKKQSQEQEIAEYQKQLEALCSMYEELKAKMDSRIPAEEHLALVNDLKSCLQEEQERRSCEVEAVMAKIASLQAENKKLLLEKNNFTADKKMLETEMQMTQKTNRRLKKKIGLLQLQLEEAIEKEVTACHCLTNLTGLVEKMAKEHDHLMVLARCFENENRGVLKKMTEGSVRLGRLEEKVKV
ncbi:CEP89 protein, partial [Acrocephalus arundinaceus]|nr:CEP89 protein [Acrocephalus arundinaceus]